MKNILEYLKETYHPLAVIVYGSYAEGTHHAESDFDALVISASHPIFHDMSCVDDVQLDVFVYPASHFKADFDCDPFIQIFDGNIVLDDGIGQNLKDKISVYLASLPAKSDAEMRDEIAWCRKMLARAGRSDAEGLYRRHWLLTETLEIYCDLTRQPYLGPKKSLRRLRAKPKAYALYEKALRDTDKAALSEWVQYLELLSPQAEVPSAEK